MLIQNCLGVYYATWRRHGLIAKGYTHAEALKNLLALAEREGIKTI